MIFKSKKIRAFVFLLLLGLGSLINGNDNFNIITNNPLYLENINSTMLYDIYTLRVDFDLRSEPITIIHMPRHSIEYKVFIEQFLHMSESSYEDILNSRSYSNKGINIIRARNTWDLVWMVENIPSSIGYVSPFIYINSGTCCAIHVIDVGVTTK